MKPSDLMARIILTLITLLSLGVSFRYVWHITRGFSLNIIPAIRELELAAIALVFFFTPLAILTLISIIWLLRGLYLVEGSTGLFTVLLYFFLTGAMLTLATLLFEL